MKRLFLALLVLLGTSFVALPSGFAQDTLLDFDDVVFTDGQDTTTAVSDDSQSEVPDDVVFTDGQDAATTVGGPTDGTTDAPKSLWGIFVAGLLGGFLAILMPCIYPLIPLTVSFFT